MYCLLLHGRGVIHDRYTFEVANLVPSKLHNDTRNQNNTINYEFRNVIYLVFLHLLLFSRLRRNTNIPFSIITLRLLKVFRLLT
jgi:hypothetical protein